MWVKSEADRKMYNLDHVHTVEVLKKGNLFYVVALFNGISVNSPINVGDAHVAQLSSGRGEDDAHQFLGRITRALGEGVINFDTAESRKKAVGNAPAKPAPTPEAAAVPDDGDGDGHDD